MSISRYIYCTVAIFFSLQGCDRSIDGSEVASSPVPLGGLIQLDLCNPIRGSRETVATDYDSSQDGLALTEESGGPANGLQLSSSPWDGWKRAIFGPGQWVQGSTMFSRRGPCADIFRLPSEDGPIQDRSILIGHRDGELEAMRIEGIVAGNGPTVRPKGSVTIRSASPVGNYRLELIRYDRRGRGRVVDSDEFNAVGAPSGASAGAERTLNVEADVKPDSVIRLRLLITAPGDRDQRFVLRNAWLFAPDCFSDATADGCL